LAILDEFINYQQNPPLIEGKPQSLNDFCQIVADNVSSKQSTVKRLIFDYKKSLGFILNYSFYAQMRRRRHGKLFQTEARISYSKDLDLELADWVHCSMDLGYVLTRDCIKQKALEVIKKENPNFKGSDSWLYCFLSRYNFSLRKLNEKSPFQCEELKDISDKFKLKINQIINKNKIDPAYIINMDETPFFWEYLPRRIATKNYQNQPKAGRELILMSDQHLILL